MFGITDKDVITVYEQLKNRFDLSLTTTAALDESFTIDCPIIVGKAHGQIGLSNAIVPPTVICMDKKSNCSTNRPQI